MPTHDIIVIGASAGGVEALARTTGDFPADFAAAVFVVLHLAPEQRSLLPQILARGAAVPVERAVDGEPIRPGRIYVAPPDHHLLVTQGRVRVVQTARENGHRPAVDPLFRSAAAAYGERVIGVVLSGSLDDGTEGLRAIKRRGGLAVVQDPEDALYPGMPRSAVEHADPDFVRPLHEIGKLLVNLVEADRPLDRAGFSEGGDPRGFLDAEMAWAGAASAPEPAGDDPPLGSPSGFSCPECHGSLWDLSDERVSRFRCRVGHAFTAESLVAEQSRALEGALWVALRALEERAALTRRLAEGARRRRHPHTARQFETAAADAERRAEHLRAAIVAGGSFSGGVEDEGAEDDRGEPRQ